MPERSTIVFAETGRKEDNGSEVTAEHGRRRLKPRHKFTKENLKVLRQLFEENPYPDYKTKDNLAQEFRCQVYVIENWFQNKRSRLRGKNFDTKRTHKSRDYMLTGHQDTQGQAPSYTTGQVPYDQVAPWSLAVYSVETQEASGSCGSVIQSIRTRSSGAVWYQGTTGSGSSFNFRPTNFTPPAMCEHVQGQRQMDDNYSLPQSYQEPSFAGWLTEQPSHRDLEQQVPLFLSASGPVRSRLKCGSGPVHISGQHLVAVEEDAESEDEDEEDVKLFSKGAGEMLRG
ncbi:hypothetical protein STEG23_029099 [Scotinomys teguina]